MEIYRSMDIVIKITQEITSLWNHIHVSPRILHVKYISSLDLTVTIFATSKTKWTFWWLKASASRRRPVLPQLYACSRERGWKMGISCLHLSFSLFYRLFNCTLGSWMDTNELVYMRVLPCSPLTRFAFTEWGQYPFFDVIAAH